MWWHWGLKSNQSPTKDWWVMWPVMFCFVMLWECYESGCLNALLVRVIVPVLARIKCLVVWKLKRSLSLEWIFCHVTLMGNVVLWIFFFILFISFYKLKLWGRPKLWGRLKDGVITRMRRSKKWKRKRKEGKKEDDKNVKKILKIWTLRRRVRRDDKTFWTKRQDE